MNERSICCNEFLIEKFGFWICSKCGEMAKYRHQEIQEEK